MFACLRELWSLVAKLLIRSYLFAGQIKFKTYNQTATTMCIFETIKSLVEKKLSIPVSSRQSHWESSNTLSASAANSSNNSRSNSPRSSVVVNHHASSSVANNGNGITSAQQSSLANTFNARSSSANQIIPVSSATANQNVPFFTNLSMRATSPDATNNAATASLAPNAQVSCSP